MRKETKLMRIPQVEKFTDWQFVLPHKNIILDSIKAYGCKKNHIEDEVGIQIYLSPTETPIVISNNLAFKDYEAVLIKYDIVQKATKFTIKAEDCIDISSDSKGNYTFYMEKDTEVNI